MFLILPPLANVHIAVNKYEGALTIKFIIPKLTDISVAISPNKVTLAMLFVIFPLADIFSPVRKREGALAVLSVILIFANIHATLRLVSAQNIHIRCHPLKSRGHLTRLEDATVVKAVSAAPEDGAENMVDR